MDRSIARNALWGLEASHPHLYIVWKYELIEQVVSLDSNCRLDLANSEKRRACVQLRHHVSEPELRQHGSSDLFTTVVRLYEDLATTSFY